METSLFKILFLLYLSVGKATYNDLIEEIIDKKIGEFTNCPKPIYDSNIPRYDKSQWFRLKDDDFTILLEVLGINNDILQGKVMIQIKRPILSAFSKTKKLYDILVDLVTQVYGQGYPLNISGVDTINFQNNEKIVYIHSVRQNKWDIITINI